MSGHKVATVAISSEEYRTLYENEMQTQWENDVQVSLHPDSQIISNQNLLDAVAQNLSISTNYSDGSNGYEMSKLDTHHITTCTLNQENNSHPRDTNLLDVYGDEQFRRTSAIISSMEDYLETLQNEAAFNRTIQLQNLDHFIQEIDQIKQTIEIQNIELANLEKKLNQDANSPFIDRWRDLAVESLRKIENLPGPSTLPDQDIIQIRNQINLADQNLKWDRLDAALALYQQAVINTEKLLTIDEIERTTRYFLREQLLDRFERIDSFIFSHSTIEAIDRNGSPNNVHLSLHEWTDGAFDDVIQVLDEYREWLQSDVIYADINEIRMGYENLLTLFENFNQCVHLARMNALNSQLKYEVANRVVLALVKQGFQPKCGEFQWVNGDEIYYAEVENGERSQVKIIIESGEGELPGNRINLFSLDATQRTEFELRERAKEIRNTILEDGLTSSQFIEAQQPTGNYNITDQGIHQLQIQRK